MTVPRLIAAMLATALIGGLTGALIALAVTDGNEDERGTIVRLAADSIFWEGADDVWCSDHHRFCIPRFEAPEGARAFYLGDPHQPSRNLGCSVEWRPDFDISGFPLPVGEPGTGAFRANCSGSTFLRDGTRIFGPAPRNLDEFAVTVRRETVDSTTEVVLLEVDTRTLICGDWGEGYTGEIPGPECELAPPFD